MRKVTLLGATGSIGTSTLTVLREHPEDFRVVGLAAGRAGEKIIGLGAEFPDAAIAVAEESPSFRRDLRAAGHRGQVFMGDDAAEHLTRHVDADIRVAAIRGTGGLASSFAAAEMGGRVLLANKEALVSAGRLFMKAARDNGTEVLPLDSEHSAIWQCIGSYGRSEIEKITITASGGPFREWAREKIAVARPKDALRHPVWSMGEKISVDSASLANKALEVIEAMHLFHIQWEALDVLVHPQAAVHGMVEFIDGSVIAHMGVSDMRQPIQHMLFYPDKRPSPLKRLDLAKMGRLEFFEPDTARFPILEIGMEVARRGGKYPALFNAANECAVELFLAERIGFMDMAEIIRSAMNQKVPGEFTNLDEVREIHELARRCCTEFMRSRSAEPV